MINVREIRCPLLPFLFQLLSKPSLLLFFFFWVLETLLLLFFPLFRAPPNSSTWPTTPKKLSFFLQNLFPTLFRLFQRYTHLSSDLGQYTFLFFVSPSAHKKKHICWSIRPNRKEGTINRSQCALLSFDLKDIGGDSSLSGAQHAGFEGRF